MTSEPVRDYHTSFYPGKNNFGFFCQGGLTPCNQRKEPVFRGANASPSSNDLAPIRFLSREEFEALKKLNPRLIEMRAGDIHYLTEPPIKN